MTVKSIYKIIAKKYGVSVSDVRRVPRRGLCGLRAAGLFRPSGPGTISRARPAGRYFSWPARKVPKRSRPERGLFTEPPPLWTLPP